MQFQFIPKHDDGRPSAESEQKSDENAFELLNLVTSKSYLNSSTFTAPSFNDLGNYGKAGRDSNPLGSGSTDSPVISVFGAIRTRAPSIFETKNQNKSFEHLVGNSTGPALLDDASGRVAVRYDDDLYGSTWEDLSPPHSRSRSDKERNASPMKNAGNIEGECAVLEVSLKDSQVIVGTCKDMCPEKERYLREASKRLSIFEIIPGTNIPGQNPSVDHSRAVKEYSRSSADQAMPLPCELRPQDVLKMTMDYLIENILDEGRDGLWDEWYNFLWNRMRGIRKDITQQRLCNETIVELVEKSARFHILCSEMLCEQDAAVFDHKINDENLTKCLQTLKELYHDLYVRHGIVCRHEAEFRGYMVLMKINDAGDILREAQNWRPEIRRSTAFKSSIQAYSSISNINYIKFFKLAGRANYLESCILHRYFYQVRSLAVTRIARAFKAPSSVITYPAQELIRHLCFESTEEADTFLRHLGYCIEDNAIRAINNELNEETSFLPKRSYLLVGSKVKTTLREVVNGSKNASLNDFEELEDEEEDAIEDEEVVIVEAEEEAIEAEEAVEHEDQSIDSDSEIFEDETEELIRKDEKSEIYDFEIDDMNDTSEKVVHSSNAEMNSSLPKDGEKYEVLLSENENVEEPVELNDEDNNIADREVAEKEKLALKCFQAKRENRLVRMSIGKWKAFIERKMRQKEKLFPSTVNLFQNATEIFHSMFPKSYQSISSSFLPLNENIGVTLLGTEKVIDLQRDTLHRIVTEEKDMQERKAFCLLPIDAIQMVANSISPDLCQNSKIFWKLAVSLPPKGRVFTQDHDVFIEWLSRKLNLTHDNGKKDAVFCDSQSRCIMIPGTQRFKCVSVNVCIKTITSVPSKIAVQGATSLMFFIRDHTNDYSDCHLLEMESQRLAALLREKLPLPAPNLIVICSSKDRHWTVDFVATKLHLQSHAEKQLINSFVVSMREDASIDSVETSKLLEDGIGWLIRRSLLPTPVRTRLASDFFAENIQRLFFEPILKILKKRQRHSLKDFPFCKLIGCYNDVTRWLIHKVTAHDLAAISWPPSEFCSRFEDLPIQEWNTTEALDSLERFLCQQILLPNFPTTDDPSWNVVCTSLSDYITNVTQNSQSAWELKIYVSDLIEKVKKEHGKKRYRKGTSSLSSSLLPSCAIVLACIQFRLSLLLGSKDQLGKPLTVTYVESSLSGEDCPSIDSLLLPSDLIAEETPKDKMHFNNSRQPQESGTKSKSEKYASNPHVDALFDQIKAEKEKSIIFEKCLEDVFEEGDESPEKERKLKKLKLALEEFKTSGPQTSVDLTVLEKVFSSRKLAKDLDYLEFEIKQEKLAMALDNLKLNRMLSHLS